MTKTTAEFPKNGITIRGSKDEDLDFILSLSPRLAEVAALSWHTDVTLQNFQDAYIIEMFKSKTGPTITYIAEDDQVPLGFVVVCETKDSISEEICGTIPLLAVSPTAQGRGVGKLLMRAAEAWSKDHNHRLLHLEVFANNANAQGFYEGLGFSAETLVMIKPLS